MTTTTVCDCGWSLPDVAVMFAFARPDASPYVLRLTCPMCGDQVFQASDNMTPEAWAVLRPSVVGSTRPTPPKRGKWGSHAMCDGCWEAHRPGTEPIRIKAEYAKAEACCFCANPTNAGIYVRWQSPAMCACPHH